MWGRQSSFKGSIKQRKPHFGNPNGSTKDVSPVTRYESKRKNLCIVYDFSSLGCKSLFVVADIHDVRGGKLPANKGHRRIENGYLMQLVANQLLERFWDIDVQRDEKRKKAINWYRAVVDSTLAFVHWSTIFLPTIHDWLWWLLNFRSGNDSLKR